MKRIHEAGDTPRCKVFLNGKEVNYAFKVRVGSNGWIDAYEYPFRINSKKDEAARLPRMRGKVEVVLCHQ